MLTASASSACESPAAVRNLANRSPWGDGFFFEGLPAMG